MSSRDLLEYIRKIMVSQDEEDYNIDGIILYDNDPMVPSLDSNLLVEHETYKRIPGTKMYYRKDVRSGRPGDLTHVHVMSKNKELFAINIDGTGHDRSKGSKYQLNNKTIDWLKSMGFNPPANGLIEWRNIGDLGGRQLLLD